jgi:hypothetical protein
MTKITNYAEPESGRYTGVIFKKSGEDNLYYTVIGAGLSGVFGPRESVLYEKSSLTGEQSDKIQELTRGYTLSIIKGSDFKTKLDKILKS